MRAAWARHAIYESAVSFFVSVDRSVGPRGTVWLPLVGCLRNLLSGVFFVSLLREFLLS